MGTAVTFVEGLTGLVDNAFKNEIIYAGLVREGAEILNLRREAREAVAALPGTLVIGALVETACVRLSL